MKESSSSSSIRLGGAVISDRVVAALLEELRTGRYADADRLPAEVDLAAELGVSRTVIRDALSEMERAGYIERVRGIGTVVNRTVLGLRSRLDQKLEYYPLIRSFGSYPHADGIQIYPIRAGAELARDLAIAPGDEVICIKKRILADTTPVIYSIDYLPRALFGSRDYTRIDLSGGVFDILEQECNQQISSNVAHLKASCGDEAIRAAMRLAPGEAMLLLDEICFNRLCHPVMRSLSYYTNFFDFSSTKITLTEVKFMRHLIDPLDFSQEEITSLLDLADRIRSDPAAYQDVAAHKKLATLFYEPSTRTRLSFEAAMLNLGGHVLGFPSETVSSASKGESVADTIRVVSCYADIVAMRHPKEGAPFRASRYSRIPVINAGDGGHQHPTQTMTDLMTIRTRMGRLDNLTIGLCGDLKFGRTVHSLIKTMARCKNIRFVLISPEELRVPDYIIKDVLEANGIEYRETRSLEESMPELDILYMTRVQKERFFNEEDYIRLKNSYILTSEKMALAKPEMAVLHPLPRVNEIALDVDNDPRAAYFEQVQNGVYIRMALIMTLLGLADPKAPKEGN